MFVTSIFRDGRGFVPTAIFTPQFFDYDSRNHERNFDVKNKPNVTLTENDTYSENNPLVDDIRESAYLKFQRLYKNDTESPQVSVADDSSDFKKTFDQLAEKRLRNQAEIEYNNFIAKREEKIRGEQERLKKLDAYNQKLADKAIEAKIRDAEKKRHRRNNLNFLKGLLLGDKDDPSIPKLILGILTAPQLGFFRLWKTNIHRIHAVSAISPVTFDFGGGYYRTSPNISIKCKVKPRKHSIFAGIYRKWCNQFVRKIIEKRQRGPPSNKIYCQNMKRIIKYIMRFLYNHKHCY